MTNLLERLNDPSFMPHGHCYQWQPDILWLHVGSNSLIALAYFVIPAVLFIFAVNNKNELPHKDLLYLFIVLILFCGFTHLVEIYTTWHPAYLFQGWVKAATASVSVITTLVLLPRIPELLNLRSLLQNQCDLEARFQEQQTLNNQMQVVHQASLDRENRVVELKKEVNFERTQQGLPPRYTFAEGSD